MIAAGIWIMFQSWAKPGENNGEKKDAPDTNEERSSSCAPRTVITLHIKSLGLLIRVLKEPAAIDRDCSGTIDFKEACVLGLALSLNNLAGGLGGGMVGLNPELTAALTALVSFFFFVVGIRLGHNYFSRWVGDRATQIAGLALVAIGVYELFI
jgi:putative sporulation protein YtaF